MLFLFLLTDVQTWKASFSSGYNSTFVTIASQICVKVEIALIYET